MGLSMMAGQELLVTYVDPSLTLNDRQRELAAWGFGNCDCNRCIFEKVAMTDGDGTNELEDELRRALPSDLDGLDAVENFENFFIVFKFTY